MPSRLAQFGSVVVLLSLLAGGAAAASKRKKQEYGAPEPATTPGQVLLWVPRIGFFPLYLVSEYVVRQPVGALVRAAEREQWHREIVDFFTFGDRGQISVYPSALFDFGLKPSVGFNAGWRHFLAEKNNVRLHFGTWGPDWIALKGVDEYELSPDDALSFHGSFVRRKDEPFYGMGPRSPSEPRFRFQSQIAELAVGYERRFWRSSRFDAQVGFRARDFGDGACCAEESVGDAVRDGTIPPPPGLGAGYSAGFQRLSIAVDSRKPKPASGSGVRAEAFGESVFAPAEDRESRRAWVNYGGALGAAVDVYGARVLALKVDAELADPLKRTIPFTDQVSLGGEKGMRGYLRNRLIDRSSLVARMQYTWPVWVFLDGVIQTDVGNVFGEHFEGFEWGLLRLSTGIGIRSNGQRDSGFELLVAGATDPFDTGFRYSSFRFVVGSHHGF